MERETIPRVRRPHDDRTGNRPRRGTRSTGFRGPGGKPADGGPSSPDDRRRPLRVPRLERPRRDALGRGLHRPSWSGPGTSAEIAALLFDPPQEFLGGFVFGVHVQRLTEGLPRLLTEAFLEVHP